MSRAGLLTTALLLPFFFFQPPPPTQIYTLSLHDALPISPPGSRAPLAPAAPRSRPAPDARSGRSISTLDGTFRLPTRRRDRKSTRLNSSHQIISYAVFCLKKKKKRITHPLLPLTTSATRT